jgi:hypothetical protein
MRTCRIFATAKADVRIGIQARLGPPSMRAPVRWLKTRLKHGFDSRTERQRILQQNQSDITINLVRPKRRAQQMSTIHVLYVLVWMRFVGG